MSALDMPTSKLEAALEAVRRGFHVFPLVPNGKSPAVEGWKELATQDESKIREWWDNKKSYNIGGRTDHLLVLDMDPRSGGHEGMALLSPVRIAADEADENPKWWRSFYVRPSRGCTAQKQHKQDCDWGRTLCDSARLAHPDV